MHKAETLHFYDENKTKLVNFCPSCGADFIVKKGAVCTFSCPEKQLEMKHEEISVKVIEVLLPSIRLKTMVNFLHHWSAQKLPSEGWGWTNDVARTITIPWWTLRSKKEFLDTLIHELGHINSYVKKFDANERNILEKVASLRKVKVQAREDYNFEEFFVVSQEIRKIMLENEELFAKYQSWEGHDYNPWYLEYLKLHQKILDSPYSEYFYGNIKPRSHGFNEKGEGKYDRNKL